MSSGERSIGPDRPRIEARRSVQLTGNCRTASSAFASKQWTQTILLCHEQYMFATTMRVSRNWPGITWH